MKDNSLLAEVNEVKRHGYILMAFNIFFIFMAILGYICFCFIIWMIKTPAYWLFPFISFGYAICLSRAVTSWADGIKEIVDLNKRTDKLVSDYIKALPKYN